MLVGPLGSFGAFLDSLNGLKMLVIVQLLALAAFLIDLLTDLRSGVAGAHVLVETLVFIALALGLWLGIVQLRRHLARIRLRDSAVAAASGELAGVVALRFQEWHLTSAEADVALFALKGFDTAEIAELRHAAPGTVRAQLARVYAKAGVPSRAALVASFFEELLEIPTGHGAAPPALPPQG
jgi:DNA-binding CsgD family transcriptional regulator